MLTWFPHFHLFYTVDDNEIVVLKRVCTLACKVWAVWGKNSCKLKDIVIEHILIPKQWKWSRVYLTYTVVIITDVIWLWLCLSKNRNYVISKMKSLNVFCARVMRNDPHFYCVKSFTEKKQRWLHLQYFHCKSIVLVMIKWFSLVLCHKCW